MLYELRIYEAVPGHLPDINNRFANHTIGLFKEHGIGMLGFWMPEIGASNRLVYITTFDSMADREKKWGAFQADPRWHEIRAETEKNGPIVARVLNTFMRLTPYSPQPRITSKVQELRIYHAMPGKLPALHQRFANHTTGFFKKYGMEVVAYWTEDVGANNHLVYMLGYPSLGDREKSWAAFSADPEWHKVVAESHRGGVLNEYADNMILRLTPYSPK